MKIFNLRLKFIEHASYYLVFFSCLHSSRAKVIEWQQTNFLKVIKSQKIFRDICHVFSVTIAIKQLSLSIHASSKPKFLSLGKGSFKMIEYVKFHNFGLNPPPMKVVKPQKFIFIMNDIKNIMRKRNFSLENPKILC